MSSCFHNGKKEKSASYLYCYLYFFFILPLLSYLSGRFFVTHYVLSCVSDVDTEFDCRFLNFVFFNVSGLVSDTVFQTTS